MKSPSPHRPIAMGHSGVTPLCEIPMHLHCPCSSTAAPTTGGAGKATMGGGVSLLLPLPRRPSCLSADLCEEARLPLLPAACPACPWVPQMNRRSGMREVSLQENPPFFPPSSLHSASGTLQSPRYRAGALSLWQVCSFPINNVIGFF